MLWISEGGRRVRVAGYTADEVGRTEDGWNGWREEIQHNRHFFWLLTTAGNCNKIQIDIPIKISYRNLLESREH